MNDKQHILFDQTTAKTVNLYLRPGLVEPYQKKISLMPHEDNFNYVNVGEAEKLQEPYVVGDEMAIFFIRIDSLQTYSEMHRYTYTGVAADMGGLYKSLFLSFFFSVSYFTRNHYFLKFIATLYTKK